MPKSVTCPACRSKVKAPNSAVAGSVLTCPDCDERFTPPHLKPKGYSPSDEDSYDVSEPRDEDEDAERQEKRRKVRAINAAGEQHRQRINTKMRAPVFGPFDIILLIVAAAVLLGAGVGIVVAKKAPSAGMAAVIIIAFCFSMFVLMYRRILKRK